MSLRNTLPPQKKGSTALMETVFLLLSSARNKSAFAPVQLRQALETITLAGSTRVVIAEATSSSWPECLDVDDTFSIVIHNANFYNFLNNKKTDTKWIFSIGLNGKHSITQHYTASSFYSIG